MADPGPMEQFAHERLDVYQAAIQFVRLADALIDGLPRGRSYLGDQLARASSSVALNIAEGAGEFAPAEKARFYRIARRSATESAAILDVCTALDLAQPTAIVACREPLLRIAAMLTKMIQNLTATP